MLQQLWAAVILMFLPLRAMIALMEQAACNAIVPCLDSSTSSVGIKMDTTHEAATLLGKKIIATAKLVAVDGRKLTFKVGACDDHGPIGTGTHERFLIDAAKFMDKLAAKG